MELYTNFYKMLLFMKMYFSSSFMLRYVRAEMNVHVLYIYKWTWSKGVYWYPRKKNIVKIYVQSQWKVILLWYHIFWQSYMYIHRGRHTQLCIITSLKRIIQICSNFYCKYKLLSTLPIHIVAWGNLPFKKTLFMYN